MSIKTVQNDIATGVLARVYLLYGEERYLVMHYADALGQNCDCESFDGAVAAGRIILAADALPFLAEKRAVYVRDSKLFAAGRKDDSEAMAAYIPKIPEETVLIFVETDVDKRTRLYKRVTENGRAIDCAHLAPPELTRWVAKRFRAHGKTISPDAASTLARSCAHSMTALVGEIDKLAAYAGARPDITQQDIHTLCTPTLQTRIFELLAAMGRGDTAAALTLYANMLHMKEHPLAILTMLIRQFRIILQCKCAAEKNLSKAETAKTFALHPFVVSEALSQARRYTTQKLIAALLECQDLDLRIKSSRIDPQLGVEMLIISR